MRPLVLLAVVAVLAALIGGSCGDDSTGDTGTQAANTTEAPITTTEAPTTTEAEPTAIQIAKDSIAAWNSGDVDAFLAFFTEDATYLGRYAVASPHFRDGCDFWMTLGDQTVLEECEEWEDGRIRCHGIGRDNLSGPAGAVSEALWSFWITDGQISRVTVGELDQSSFYFVREMGWWLEDAHPDVWESTFAIPEQCPWDEEYNCWSTWYGTAETAAALLEFAPEFIAQSDKYSITE